MDYPNRIREMRKARGLTIDKLAAMAGASGLQISRLERGQRRLTLDWMERIATALDISPAELLPSRPGVELGGPAAILPDKEQMVVMFDVLFGPYLKDEVKKDRASYGTLLEECALDFLSFVEEYSNTPDLYRDQRAVRSGLGLLARLRAALSGRGNAQ